MLKNQAAGIVRGEPAAPALGRLRPAPITIPSIWSTAWALPLVLGAGYLVAAVALVFVELAQPPQQGRFDGIRFSNAINSPGSRHIVALFREHLGWLPRPWAGETLSPTAYVAGLVIAWLAMFAVQIAAIVAVRRSRPASVTPWVIGPVIASLALLLYPPTSTDIFCYASFGWVADEGHNPYLVIPNTLPGDPYAIYNDWTHVRTPYGPIWTGLSHGIVHFSNQEPFATALGFKIVASLAGFGLAAVTYKLARRFTADPHLPILAFVLVAWSPILITEAAATVHLDPLMMLLAMAGLAVATAPGWNSHRLGVALVTASALVKPVTLPLIALLIVARAARPEPLPAIARKMAGDLLAAAALVAAGFAFYWSSDLIEAMADNARILYIDRPLRSNPLWIWALYHIDSLIGLRDAIGGDIGRFTRWLTIAAVALFAALVGRTLLRARTRGAKINDAEQRQDMLRWSVLAWAGVTVILGVLPVNAHPWYAIWSLAPLALIWITDGWRDLVNPPRWLLGINAWLAISFMVYHTWPK